MLPRALCGVFPIAIFMMLTPGCSTYLADYYYGPQPGVVTVPATQPADLPAATVLASVVGVRRGDDGENRPEAVEIRLHIDNGKDSLLIDPRSLELTSGTLVAFGAVQPLPIEPITLLPDQQLDILAIFPFAPGLGTGNVDVSTLRLKARVTIGNRPVDAAFSFQRAVPVYVGPYYHDPYYDPYFFNRNYYGGYYRFHH